MLVEDDVYFQNALVTAIGDAPDMWITCVASNCAESFLALKQPQPDVLLVDLGLPDGSGLDVIRAAHAQWPCCAIMVSSDFCDESNVILSIEAGASGYLLKDSSSHRIVDEIRCLYAGGSPISPLIARQVLLRFRSHDKAAAPEPQGASAGEAGKAALSERELEVLQLITRGFKVEEIAHLMQISRHTVRSFVRRIYAKLEVNSRTEAIYEARHQGLL
ncbi:MAG: two component LuxR family transcriptional regulator [Comamonadaceae bacterium]|nr:MAG: two component LuxR family transcriptional regulator [Comamonadaceae bacterium]